MSQPTPTEQPPNPSPNNFVEVGEVSPEVMSGVNAMRQRTAELLHEIGRLEMQKSNLMQEIRRLENQSQTLLRQEATRIGIPEGSPWQLTPEGKALAPPSA